MSVGPIKWKNNQWDVFVMLTNWRQFCLSAGPEQVYVLFWRANRLSYLQGWRDCKGLQGLPGLHGLRMMGLWLGDKLKSKTRLHALALWLSACGLFFVGVSSCSLQHCKLKCYKDSLSGIMVLQHMKHDTNKWGTLKVHLKAAVSDSFNIMH